MKLLLWIDEEADLVATNIGTLVKAGKERKEVHLHRHLTGLEGVEPLGHVGIAHAWRGAALVKRLIEFQSLDRVGRVDEALHLIGFLRIVVLEAPIVERVGHAHRDAFRAALGVNVSPVNLLAVDLSSLKEFGDPLESIAGLWRAEGALVFLLEIGLN